MPLHIPAVKEDSASSKEHARVFHQLLGAIEAVRLKRQAERALSVRCLVSAERSAVVR